MRLTLTFLAILLPLSAFAFSLTRQNEALEAEMSGDKTILHLTESARKTVEHDRLKATLRIEHEAKTSREVQDYINKKMTEAINLAKQNTDLKVETHRYSVYKQERWEPRPLGGAKKRETYWRGSQNMSLDGADKDALLALAGKIQDMGFATSGISYYLSRDARESYRDELITKALANMKKRASLIGTQLGLPKVHFAEINFGGAKSSPVQPMMMRAMAMDSAMEEKAMTTPVAESGEEDVQISVNVKVYLSK